MQAVIKATIVFLGLNPFFLGAISALIFAAGAMLQGQENRTNVAKAHALRAGPPPVVAMDAAKAAAAAHPFAEVSVKAQLDMSMSYDIILEGSGADRFGFMVPLLADDAATAEAEVLGILLMDDAGLTEQDLGAIDFGPRAEGEGAFGPVLMLNGMIGDLGDFDDAVAEIFAQEARPLPTDLPVLRSFEGERAAAYDPSWPFEVSIFGAFAWIGGIVGLYALMRSAIYFRPSEPGGQARDDAEGVPEDMIQDAV